MSSATAHDRPFAGWHGGGLRFLRNALASTNRREASYAFFIGLLIAAVNCTWLFESMEKSARFDMVLASALMPLLVSPFALAAWVVADRADGARLGRGWRIALCVAVAVGVAALIIPTLIELVGLPWRRWLDEKPEFAKIPDWAMRFEFWLRASIYTGLALGVFEMSQRRAKSQRALEAVRREQAALARQLLESRLAAMQAQVEPQFLFDSLVDVQATYDRD
ncbi:MAG TPA: hypothetical protein VFR86_12570, partial [Burkholderiaceae bacterium]|nr:hypothetical protein [Burkholderiaceae bacterium]